MTTIIGNYELETIIGNGAFGDVYSCRNYLTKKCYALKIDKISSGIKTIKYEASILKFLKKIPNVTKLIHYGCIDKRQYMVMDIYGLSLEEYIIMNHGEIPFMERVNIMLQMLNIIKDIHNGQIIHRDIKPENFVFSMDRKQLVLIDFGIAITTLINNRKPVSELIGSLRYASIYSHKLIELGKRDDLISMVYTCMRLFFNTLPWENMDDTDDKYKIVELRKDDYLLWINIYELILSNNIKNNKILQQLIIISKYLYSIPSDEKPNYFLIEIHVNNMSEMV